MATPASGPISMQQIHDNLQQGHNLGAYRGKTFWTPEGAQRTISQAPSFNELRNLQLGAPAAPLNRAQIYEVGMNGDGNIQIAYRPRTGELWVWSVNGMAISHWYAVQNVNPFFYQSLSVAYSLVAAYPNGPSFFNVDQGQGTGSPDDFHIIGVGGALGGNSFYIRIDFTGNPK